MFSTFDRCSLGMAVLRGEPDANRILADMLDEEGDRGLAQWARAPKKRLHKRLDFVLSILPYKVDVQLACEFFAHALQYHRDTDWLIKGVQRIGAWASQAGTTQDLDGGCESVGRVEPWHFGVKDIDRIAQSLHTAAKCAEVADQLRNHGRESQFRGHAAESRNAVRRVARGSREFVKYLAAHTWGSWSNLANKWRGPSNRYHQPNELQWQVDRVEQILQEMLEP